MLVVTWSQLLLKILGTRGYSDLGDHCGESNRGADEDTHSLVFNRSWARVRVVLRRCSSQTASPIILSLSRAMFVSGPSSIRSNRIEISALRGLKDPRSRATRRRTYSANDAKLSGLSSGLTLHLRIEGDLRSCIHLNHHAITSMMAQVCYLSPRQFEVSVLLIFWAVAASFA